MDRIDRRTFLAAGLKTGAAVAVIGKALHFPDQDVRSLESQADPSAGPAAQHSSSAVPYTLTTTGVAVPVGVDPDDVEFAWRSTDARRGARQGGYRLTVSKGGSARSVVWDSGEVFSAQQAFVRYGGPSLEADTRYRWVVRTADPAGHWSAPSSPATFTTGLRDADWDALWLRPGPVEAGLEEYTYLRTTEHLPSGDIDYATAYVAAAHKYQLWVNGRRLDTGPSFCFPDEQYYQATDVTAALAAGKSNAIGILHHWYGPGRGRPTSAPGLLVQVTVHYANGTVVKIGSAGGWLSQRAEWLPAPQRNNDSGDFVEWIDGRLSPVGWSQASFDDRTWTPAAVLGPVGTAPFTTLYAQRTRITERVVTPSSLKTLPTGSVVVDFGKVYAGRPTVEFLKGVEGHGVPMHVGYTLDPDGSVSTTHNTQGTDLSFSYIQRSGEQVFEPYVYLGFRYLQIDQPGEVIGGGQVALVARHAQMPTDEAATFTTSNRTLDAVWALCQHSGLYTSQEQFIDTPTREKGQFLWDAANESQTVMRSFGEQNLSWQGIRDMARAQARYWPTSGEVNEVYPNDDGPQNYPTFSAIYPEWVWRYYLSTGDAATVTALAPVLSQVAGYFVANLDPATGLVSNQPLSTNGDNEYGYDYDTVADTMLNILVYNAFSRISAVASLDGDTGQASLHSQRAAALAASINTRLVDSAGLYVDGLKSDGGQSPHTSQLANASALAYGIVPQDRVPTVAEHVASLDISVEPDHGMELLRALHVAGRDADVVRILTDPSFPGWAAILRSGGTFTWETWTPSDLIGDSMSHGWGSSALVAMQESLLGVAPVQPVPEGAPYRFAVALPTGGVERASGRFPTPAGPMTVSWLVSSGRRSLSVVVPPNASALCELRGATTSNATESGTPIRAASGVSITAVSSGNVSVEVGAGSYRFDW